MRRADYIRAWYLLRRRSGRLLWRGAEWLERSEGFQRWLPFLVLGAISALSFWLTAALLLRLHEVTGGDAFQVDRYFLALVRSHTPPYWTPFLFFVTELLAASAGLVLFGIILCLILLLWALGRWREAVGTTTAALLVTSGVWIAKLYFQRARPDVAWALALETSYSFPSGHAASSVVIYGMAAYLLSRTTRRRDIGIAAAAVAGFLILATGFSRVYLAVHYPTDVAAGFGVGTVWLLTAILVTEALYLLYRPAAGTFPQQPAPTMAANASSSQVRNTGRRSGHGQGSPEAL